MPQTANQLQDKLDELKQKRKNGEINEIDYYYELLRLLKEVIENLEIENISPNEVKKQIPLILVFLSEQISKFSNRGN